MSKEVFPHIHIFNSEPGKIYPTYVEINGQEVRVRRITYNAAIDEVPTVTLEVLATVGIDIDNALLTVVYDCGKKEQ